MKKKGIREMVREGGSEEESFLHNERGWKSDGFKLLLWDILVGIPVSATLTWLNHLVFTALGYEKLMRLPGGLRGSRWLFIATNIVLVVGWAIQINREAKEARIREIREEIEWWDETIEMLKVEREKAKGVLENQDSSPSKLPKIDLVSMKRVESPTFVFEHLEEDESAGQVVQTPRSQVAISKKTTQPVQFKQDTPTSLAKSIEPQTKEELESTKTWRLENGRIVTLA